MMAEWLGGNSIIQLAHSMDVHASVEIMHWRNVETKVRESEVARVSTNMDIKARMCVANGEFMLWRRLVIFCG